MTDDENEPDNSQITVSGQDDRFSSLAQELSQRVNLSSIQTTTRTKFDMLKRS